MELDAVEKSFIRENEIREKVYDVLLEGDYISSRKATEFYGDSLDSVDIVMNLEEAFDIEIPNEEAGKIADLSIKVMDSQNRAPIVVGSLVDYLVSREDVKL